MDASSLALSKVDPEWRSLLDFDWALAILNSISGEYAPKEVDVFNVFTTPPSQVKVVLIGQDPYPNLTDAMGLAFSVRRDSNLPRSLTNIFQELSEDLGGAIRSNGDLSDWQEQGVFLINRVLTIPLNSSGQGVSNGHADIGWLEFTEDVIRILGANGAVALLMGKSAAAMSKYFKAAIEVAHPSPLSAYRGFFGSKPFSRINALLTKPIEW